jgi:hypothetical protein
MRGITSGDNKNFSLGSAPATAGFEMMLTLGLEISFVQ